MTGTCKDCGQVVVNLKNGRCEVCWYAHVEKEMEEEAALEAYDNDRL